jgi:diguanylate cyclase (GGDEF)-like protein
MSKSIERIKREHALLLESIEVSSMPFAVYDSHARLIAWNQPYEQLHSLAFSRLADTGSRRPLHYEDLVRAIAEQTLEAAEIEEWVLQQVQEYRKADGTPVDRYFPGVGWFRVTQYRTRGGGIASFAIDINENKRREAELEQEIARRRALEEQLRLRALTDSLTQLPNRGAFLARGDIDFRLAQRYGDALSVIMMDADHFKQVNDTYGHQMGDEVLIALARTAECAIRSFDMVGRLGGEEFGIILVRTSIQDAMACAERIRANIEALVFDTPAGPLRITASFGVAQSAQEDGTFAELLNRADAALYTAKRNGRNRVASPAVKDGQDDRQPISG